MKWIVQRGVTALSGALVAAALGITTFVHAQTNRPLHPLSEIERMAVEFARAHTADQQGQVEIDVHALDPRTRLFACGRTQAYLASGTRLWGRTSVAVRCQEAGGWTINVPITVRVLAPVLVTTRALGRGEKVAAADLSSKTLDLTQLPLGVLTDPVQAVGKTAVAALPAGATLRPDMLRGATVVTQGQQVQILYVGEGFRVSGEGRALNNAARGSPARVRTPAGKVVKGIATAPGVVEVR
ncbi:MAG: flagellar basal body P-ring formation protein FlgA [Burkholderiales bacterium]|nr:flagellar basal body P-ring formation protein FlgA [Burkholderiales bacterium]